MKNKKIWLKLGLNKQWVFNFYFFYKKKNIKNKKKGVG